MTPLPDGTETATAFPYVGQFFDKGGAVYNVMHPDFGAKGDGSTDDTTAIIAAITAADGNICFFPEGTYIVSSFIELDNLAPNGVELIGAGAIIKATTPFTGNSIIRATALMGDTAAGPYQLKGLTLDADGNVSNCLFGNWTDAIIRDCTFQGATVYQINTKFARTYMEHCKVVGNSSQTNNGIDCLWVDSVISNLDVNMNSNALESGFWLGTGSDSVVIINLKVTDGLSAIGMQASTKICLIKPQAVGFASRGIDVVVDGATVSKDIDVFGAFIDPVSGGGTEGINFNKTDRASIVGGKVRNITTGVIFRNTPTEISLIGLDLSDTVTTEVTGTVTNLRLRGCVGVNDIQQTYAPTNVSTDRAYDADTVVVAELADIVGTLIADLQAAGFVG